MAPLNTRTTCWTALALLVTSLGYFQHGGTMAAYQFRRARHIADGLEVPELIGEQNINASKYDVVIIVTDTLDNLVGQLSPLAPVIERFQKADTVFGSTPIPVLTDVVRAGSLIYASTGTIDRDVVDDVRKFEDAGGAAVKRAVLAGKKRPLLVVPKTENGQYDTDLLVTVLGALQQLYVPLELRDVGSGSLVEHLGVWGAGNRVLRHTLRLARALEKGRIVMRDICTADPERMAPPKVEAYLRQVFNISYDISITSTSDQATLEREYPLMAAVNRGSHLIPRHQGRLINMEYTGRGDTNRTLYLIGKGITFDTGGVNLKFGAGQTGMHRDKCGAAIVAGFMKILSILRPGKLRVMGSLPMVRNNVGEESYTADEVLRARSGLTVRVGNTDAEGRMVMADPLCKIKELAVNAVNPHLFTIATLTGHAKRTSGPHYSIAMDNGPARAKGAAQHLSDIGDQFGDPIELSRLRREDFKAHVGQSVYENLINIRGASSVAAARGHQTPMAFLMQVSGLHPDHSSSNSEQALPYTHMDIAGPSLVYPGVPTGTPLIALAADFILSPADKAGLVRGVRADDEEEERKDGQSDTGRVSFISDDIPEWRRNQFRHFFAR